jgi:hypothetical protein
MFFNALFRVFIRNPLLNLVWIFFVAAPVFFFWGTSAKGLSRWLLSTLGLSDEYEALFTGGCFFAMAGILGWVANWMYHRYDDWRTGGPDST